MAKHDEIKKSEVSQLSFISTEDLLSELESRFDVFVTFGSKRMKPEGFSDHAITVRLRGADFEILGSLEHLKQQCCADMFFTDEDSEEDDDEE